MKTDVGKELDTAIGAENVDKFVKVRMAKELTQDTSVMTMEVDLAKPFALPVREFYTVEQSTHSVVRLLGALSTLNTVEHELLTAVRVAKSAAPAKENK